MNSGLRICHFVNLRIQWEPVATEFASRLPGMSGTAGPTRPPPVLVWCVAHGFGDSLPDGGEFPAFVGTDGGSSKNGGEGGVCGSAGTPQNSLHSKTAGGRGGDIAGDGDSDGGGIVVCAFRRAAGNGLDRRPGYSHNQNSDYHHVESPDRSLAGDSASDAAGAEIFGGDGGDAPAGVVG